VTYERHRISGFTVALRRRFERRIAGAAEQSRKHLGLQFAKFIGLLQELAMYGQKVS
jgi:hypothetical protein